MGAALGAGVSVSIADLGVGDADRLLGPRPGSTILTFFRGGSAVHDDDDDDDDDCSSTRGACVTSEVLSDSGIVQLEWVGTEGSSGFVESQNSSQNLYSTPRNRV